MPSKKNEYSWGYRGYSPSENQPDHRRGGYVWESNPRLGGRSSAKFAPSLSPSEREQVQSILDEFHQVLSTSPARLDEAHSQRVLLGWLSEIRTMVREIDRLQDDAKKNIFQSASLSHLIRINIDNLIKNLTKFESQEIISISSMIKEILEKFESVDLARSAVADIISAEFKEALKIVCNTEQDRILFLREIFAKIGYLDTLERVEIPPLPPKQEEQWLTHRLEDETPPDFIKRIWGTWIGQGLTSSHFFHADPPLYTAIRKWRKKHGWPDDLDLPNKKQVNDRALAERGVPSAAESLGRALREASPEVRENVRLYDVARRRQSRQRQVKSP